MRRKVFKPCSKLQSAAQIQPASIFINMFQRIQHNPNTLKLFSNEQLQTEIYRRAARVQAAVTALRGEPADVQRRSEEFMALEMVCDFHVIDVLSS